MMTKMNDERGVSTTRTPGQFQCESAYTMGRLVWYWDYRDLAGELHSGMARTQEECVEAARRFGYLGDEG